MKFNSWTLSGVCFALSLAFLAFFGCGCKTDKTIAYDGSILQANQYTGITIGYGYLRTIPDTLDYFEQTEAISTSWFNSNARDYKRVAIWTSVHTNQPPTALYKCFQPNVNTEILYTTQTNGDNVVHAIIANETHSN